MAVSLLKKISFYLTKAYLSLYLTSEKQYRTKGMKLVVLPGVFHPGFYPTSRLLLEHITKIDLKEKKVLELGAGTGMISVYCALKGAAVTASDISLKATLNIDKNSRWNRVVINNIHSDLFNNIAPQKFDYILINPPFQKTEVKTDSDFQFAAGSNFDFFKKLFSQLNKYVLDSSCIYMALPEFADQHAIMNIAASNNIRIETLSIPQGGTTIFQAFCQ